MASDEGTYGFSKPDAEALIESIGVTETTFSERTPRGSGSLRVYLYTLTAAMGSGSGTATIRTLADDTEIATSQTVVDTLGLFNGLAVGQRGICVKSGGDYYAIGPYVTKVRWDDPDLEYTKDNDTTWVNIDTAEDCS